MTAHAFDSMAGRGLWSCLARLYQRLGVDEEAELVVSVTHGGLNGRYIGAANQARFVAPGRPTSEDEISATVRVSVKELEKRLPELVKELLSPLFMVFNFFDPDQAVWEELVRKFEGGETG